MSDSSPAAFALRFAADFEGVKMVLSGMSSPEQMEENLRVMGSLAPLTDRERAAVEPLRRILTAEQLVQCTGCGYCVSGCPASIRIPDRLAAYNARLRGAPDAAARNAAVQGGEPSACVGCGECEKSCPQKLPIRRLLALAAREFA